MDQNKIIAEFLATINGLSESDYRIVRQPDCQNRTSKDIDAYAGASDAPPMAIEHTSVASFLDQRLDSARFVRVLGPLEQELEGMFDFGLDLTIRVEAITTGVNWTALQQTTKAWILTNASQLPLGRSRAVIPGVPFELAIAKHTDTPGKVWIARFAPPADETQASLALAFAAALQHKYSELAAYRSAGAISVLIVESDDIALTSPATLYAAYLIASRSVPTGQLDRIWFTRTYESPNESFCHFLCFRGPDEVMAKANHPNAMIGPNHDAYWEQIIQTEPALHRATELLLERTTMRKLKGKSRPNSQPRKKAASSRRQHREPRLEIPEGAPLDFGSRRAELERMLREQLPEKGKEDRIQKGLKALQEMRENPLGRDLDIETIKKIAEDPDLWEY